ncbi:MAG: adenosylcobinamide-phosphate synthase CbiB [Rhodobacteraceae bacterium]|nr:adenosylcobinamide-phosphate synthase CbiB [Paracoccaceae bacterium]
MNNLEILVLALALDAAIGEPAQLWRRIPHPVKLMGDAIRYLDIRFNNNTRQNGVWVILLLGIGALMLGFAIQILPDFGLFEILVTAVLIAQRSLTSHVSDVAKGLEQNLDQGKAAVAMIVGRDTKDMDETAVARSAIESAAENFSDGVIAPAFWFLLFGLPGILAYKMINTADSMIGYRSDKYRHFGWAAARLDDLVNLIPARLSGLLICAATQSRQAWEIMRRDAGQHRSPNAGWPESAMAGALDISLAGPRSYGGKLSDDLFVNHHGRRVLNASDIRDAVSILWRAWAVFGLIIIVLALIF